MRLVLASRSPRRLRLLQELGLAPLVRPAGLDESAVAGEAPRETARRLACAKSEAVARRFTRPTLVLGADTVVAVDGVTLGKPLSPTEHRDMLERLSGRTHRVYTGVALTVRPSGVEASDVAETEVVFARLSDEEIRWYVGTREGRDKAGGYGIQGLAGVLVREIHGSYSNVVGLPLELTYRLARSLGIDLLRLTVSRGPTR